MPMISQLFINISFSGPWKHRVVECRVAQVDAKLVHQGIDDVGLQGGPLRSL